MTRAVIYARFSTDLQNEKSTEDQIALCGMHAARRGLHVIQTFEDKARSGASVLGRDGLMRLMDAARARTFDVVVVEALDRLSRDMEDLAGIHKRLSFFGIEIDAVHDGTADSILIGIRGLIGQMQREDGAKKVRRGMAGVVRSGRHAGGRAYGYQVIPGRRGELKISEEEAEVVRRIFADYASGRPAEIAGDLNRDGIAPPRGTRWNASTINGNAQRGIGIIFNELYAGRIVWNKVRMVKNPDTGKRVSRPNPGLDWQVVPAPHLRIIDDDTWAGVQKLKSEKVRLHTNVKRRPAHLLSGLLRCGCCVSGMSVHDRDKTGKTRIRCSAVRESGNCTNRRIVYLRDVEKAVLSGMREELKDPRLIESYAGKYNEERQRLTAAATATRTRLKSKRDRIESERQRNIDMVIKGIIGEDDARIRIADLKAQRLQVEAEIAMLEEAPKIITLHPATLDRYVETLDALAVCVAEHAEAEDDRGSLVKRFRAVVHSVTVHSKGPREGFEVEVKGKLAALIGGDAFPQAVYSGGRVVAEVRYIALPTIEDAVFCYWRPVARFRPGFSDEQCGFGPIPPWTEHRCGVLVGEQLGRALQDGEQPLRNRSQQEGGAAHPVSEDRTIEIDAESSPITCNAPGSSGSYDRRYRRPSRSVAWLDREPRLAWRVAAHAYRSAADAACSARHR